jgi:hypothetical protein
MEEGEPMGFWRVLTIISVVAAALSASAGATANAPTGDTCTVNGSGTAYTITINIPSNGPEQGAFAVGSKGVTVGKIDASATPGSFSTTGGPAGASTAFVLNNTAVPGASVTVAVTTSGPLPASGTFTITPANFDHTTWFNPVVCTFPNGTPVPSNKFTAQKKATYSATTGTWREAVVLPGPGKVNFVHKTIAAGGTPRPLIKSGRMSVSKAGKVTLTLRPTAAGMAALTKSGTIKLDLNIEFSPTNGKPANKVVTLTLKK